MADTYNRRINLYINGKEVSNNISSIRREMNKLTNEQSRMTIGSQEYQQKTAEIRKLKGIMQQHQRDIAAVQKGWSFQKMADGFNKYFSIITAGAATFAGLFLGMKKTITTFNDYEERISNLSALTGLAGDELKWMSDKAKELSTSMLENGIVVTQSAQDIVDAFTKVGSARPELLKDKEALSAVTEEAIILSNAAKTELQPAIDALTMVMNQYNVPATEARRIINALAAGSQEGAGEIPYLTTAFEKAGTVAADAGISIETLVATIETLAPRITAPEIAGRSLKGVLLDLQATSDDTNPAVVGLATALENLGKKNMSTTELLKLFGTENITTAKILIDNVGELKKYEAAVTGTNVAIEQATINTGNNNARLAQAKNRLNIISMELGEKLAPAYGAVISKSSLMLKSLVAIVDIFSKYGGLIVTTAATIAAYTVATKLATLWQNRLNTASLASIVTQKLQALAFRAQFAGISLYNTVIALMTGKLKVATIQFRAFSAALMANPIGIITGAVVALGAGLYMLSKRLTDTEKVQKTLNSVNLEANKNIVEERLEVERLMKVAQNNLQSKEDRLAAIKKLNEISPEFLGNLTLENINTTTATESTKKYTEAILENAKAQAAKERLVEIEKKILDMQSGELSFMEEAQAAGLAYAIGIRTGATASKDAAEIDKYRTGQIKALILQKEKLLTISAKQNKSDNLTPAIPLFGVNDLLPQKPGYVSPGKPSPNKSSSTGEIDTGTEPATNPTTTTAAADFAAQLTEFLGMAAEKQQDAIRSYFSKAGEGAFEAFIAAIEKEQATKKIDFSILPEATPEQEEVNPAVDYALEKYKETNEFKLAINEAMYAKGLIGEQEYQDNLTKITLDAEEKRLAIRQEKVEDFAAIADMSANFVYTLMDMELEKAGDNEEKKKEIKKKYADIGFAVDVASIIANTAVAIMRGFADLGPIAGAIAAVLLGATGIAQIGLANAQRQKVKSMADGGEVGYTGPGSKYTKKQLVQLHAEEWVAPMEGTQNPDVRQFLDVFEVARRNGQLATIDTDQILRAIPRQMATGGFSSSYSPPVSGGVPEGRGGSGGSSTDPELKQLIAANTAAMEELKSLKIYASIEDIRKADKNYTEIQNTRGL